MIQDVAALLKAFQQKEVEAIRRSGITHAPTIGAQYEGVSATVLKMMIPSELELQVVSGFVEGVDGTLSGQIDGMLVRGSGTPIPSVQGQYKWPIKDVLAVLEVKKTLFGSDLSDAHDQLQGVMALFWEYAKTITPADGIDISAPRYVYSQILGEPAPVGSPLIALMDDQVHKLKERGLSVESIHSGRDRETSRRVCSEYLSGKLDFLFIAPERLPTSTICAHHAYRSQSCPLHSRQSNRRDS